jgi:hypothetical protein
MKKLIIDDLITVKVHKPIIKLSKLKKTKLLQALKEKEINMLQSSFVSSLEDTLNNPKIIKIHD